MIGPIVREMLLENQETFLIPAENVANVMYHHPLSHGLLVLSKVGYSKIPVLGKDDHFVGLVSLSDVVNKMIDLQTIKKVKNNENLANKRLSKVMLLRVPLRLGFDVFSLGEVSDAKVMKLRRLMKAFRQLMKIGN